MKVVQDNGYTPLVEVTDFYLENSNRIYLGFFER